MSNPRQSRHQFVAPASRILSFDLWQTLIKSDGRRFKSARNLEMRSVLAPGMAVDAFEEVVRKEDRAADDEAESSGIDVGFSERVDRVARAVGAPTLREEDVERLYEVQTVLLRRFPPVPTHPLVPQALASLAATHQLSVVSNTGFIRGREMRRVLADSGLWPRFSHLVFSNEVGFAKPHPAIFQALLDAHGVRGDQVTHFGDSVRADVMGAAATGIGAIHVRCPDDIVRLAKLDAASTHVR